MGLFLATALVLLSTSIYMVYLLLSAFFSATSLSKWFILGGLIVICVSFMFFLFFVRTSTNPIIHWLYIILSLLIGLLFYLTIFAFLFQIAKVVKLDVAPLLLSRIGIAASILLFIIGLFNAAFPVVRNLSVHMAGLSQSWQGKKIVQISDLHLGAIYDTGFLNRQITTINALNPDLIVITGDLFDDTENHITDFGPELAKLKAKEGVIFIPGNHDVALGMEKVEPALREAGITILKDQAVTINGLEVIGLDLHHLIENDNNPNVANLAPYTGQARLLLKHVPMDITWAKNLNIDLQLSGHSHNGQMFPLSILTYLFYGKYQYGFYTDGNYNIYTSSGLGSWGPPVRTFNPAEIVSITLN